MTLTQAEAKQVIDALELAKETSYSEVTNVKFLQAILIMRKAAEPHGWMPIETAHKGPKAILVYCAERKNTFTVTWARNAEYPGEGKWKHFVGEFLNEVPTHWMPLPAPPNSKAAEPPRTGSTDGLSQDYNKGLGQWFAGRLDAKQTVREVFAEPISDADILDMWNRVPNCPTFRDEVLTFARALLEKAR